MENNAITVSHIVTVFNKAPYIAATARSLLAQEGAHTREFIFVDDVSTDGSLRALEEITRGLPNVSIIQNTVNAGPSIRLNQGARLARGEYLHFFDSDDILPANASALMLARLQLHQADLLYGRWRRTDAEGPSLLGQRIPETAACRVSEAPLESVLADRFVRMALMVKRSVFQAAGGCDEGVFIQDESLPLRLAAQAKRLVTLEAPVLLVPKLEGVLSGNKSQLNHDRFLAHYNMLHSHAPMSERARAMLYARCVSAAWKQVRAGGKWRAHASGTFALYLSSKLCGGKVHAARLARLRKYFTEVQGVRRVHADG